MAKNLLSPSPFQQRQPATLKRSDRKGGGPVVWDLEPHPIDFFSISSALPCGTPRAKPIRYKVQFLQVRTGANFEITCCPALLNPGKGCNFRFCSPHRPSVRPERAGGWRRAGIGGAGTGERPRRLWRGGPPLVEKKKPGKPTARPRISPTSGSQKIPGQLE